MLKSPPDGGDFIYEADVLLTQRFNSAADQEMEIRPYREAEGNKRG